MIQIIKGLKSISKSPEAKSCVYSGPLKNTVIFFFLWITSSSILKPYVTISNHLCMHGEMRLINHRRWKYSNIFNFRNMWDFLLKYHSALLCLVIIWDFIILSLLNKADGIRFTVFTLLWGKNIPTLFILTWEWF